MTEYRRKPVVIDAVQWFKDGDHPAVQPRPAIVRFDRQGHYFYIDHAEPGADMRPTAWLAVDRQSEVVKNNSEALPFAFYEIKSGVATPIAARPDLLKTYMLDHGWPRTPRDFGILVSGERREIVAPGDWIIREPTNGTLCVCSPTEFARRFELLPVSCPSLTGEGMKPDLVVRFFQRSAAARQDCASVLMILRWPYHRRELGVAALS